MLTVNHRSEPRYHPATNTTAIGRATADTRPRPLDDDGGADPNYAAYSTSRPRGNPAAFTPSRDPRLARQPRNDSGAVPRPPPRQDAVADARRTTERFQDPRVDDSPRPSDTRDLRNTRDAKDTRDPREARDVKDTRDPREACDVKDTRDPRETRDVKDTRDSRDNRDLRDTRNTDPRTSAERLQNRVNLGNDVLSNEQTGVRRPSMPLPRGSAQALEPGQPSSVRSLLPPIGQSFAQLAPNDSRAWSAFIYKNRDILDMDYKLFLQEAVSAYRRGDNSRARICVQEFVLLSNCSKLSDQRMRIFLNKLVDEDEAVLGAFFDKVDVEYATVKEMTEADGVASQSVNEHAGRGVRDVNPGREKLLPTQGIDREVRYTGSSKGLERVPADNVASNRASRDARTSEQPTNRAATRPGDLPIREALGSNRDVRQRSMTQTSREETASQATEGQQSLVIDEVQIRAEDPRVDRLDERYQVRQDARKFFIEGRVFALMWHESAGQGKKAGQGNGKGQTNSAKYQTKVFSQIRRMIVGQEREGFCWCIPVYTYNSQGVAKHGMKEQERKAHTVLHMTKTTAFTSVEEKGMMPKSPISVSPANEDQALDRMSRAHFGMVHTVQWNVPVMNVGRVSQDSMDDFREYWDAEHSRKSDRTTHRTGDNKRARTEVRGTKGDLDCVEDEPERPREAPRQGGENSQRERERERTGRDRQESQRERDQVGRDREGPRREREQPRREREIVRHDKTDPRREREGNRRAGDESRAEKSRDPRQPRS